MTDTNNYHGSGNDLESAIMAAHEAYKAAASKADPAKDLFTTKVVTIGVEPGGFVLNTNFFADVQETQHPSQM
jgi:hypothetical protein